MENNSLPARWSDAAALLGRIVLAFVFLMALAPKVMMAGMVVGTIAAAGFPFPLVLNALAALLELGLVAALLSGTFFPEMMLLGAAYVVFLAFAFHGPSHWTDAGNLELGAFVSHFPFAAGMLFAAAHGPGRLLTIRRGLFAGRAATVQE